MRKLVLIFIVIFPFLMYGQTGPEVNPDGIIFPKYTTVERDVLAASKGQVIYNTTTDKLNVFDGSAWQAQGTTPWVTNGADIHYSSGAVGINVSNPTHQLEVVSNDTSATMVHFNGGFTGSGRNIIEIGVDAITSDGAQFIEMRRGVNIVAAIKTNGSAKFKSVQFENGSVQTKAAIGPIAFGFVQAAGGTASGTGNFSSTWNGTQNRYEITITGESYFFSSYSTLITPSSSTVTQFRVGSTGGKLLVFLNNSAGTQIQGDFQFVVYKA